MTSIPLDVALSIQDHLDAIAANFKNPKVTLVVRAPDLPDGDLVMTLDDPYAAIEAIKRLADRQAKP